MKQLLTIKDNQEQTPFAMAESNRLKNPKVFETMMEYMIKVFKTADNYHQYLTPKTDSNRLQPQG